MKAQLGTAAVAMFAVVACVFGLATSTSAGQASATTHGAPLSFTLEPSPFPQSQSMQPGRTYKTLPDGALEWRGPNGETQIIYPTLASPQRITVSPHAVLAWATTTAVSSSHALSIWLKWTQTSRFR